MGDTSAAWVMRRSCRESESTPGRGINRISQSLVLKPRDQWVCLGRVAEWGSWKERLGWRSVMGEECLGLNFLVLHEFPSHLWHCGRFDYCAKIFTSFSYLLRRSLLLFPWLWAQSEDFLGQGDITRYNTAIWAVLPQLGCPLVLLLSQRGASPESFNPFSMGLTVTTWE